MAKSYRIRTTPNNDTNLHVKLEQDYDLLEILSLKIVNQDIYRRMCGDYGVIIGRVEANNGFGVPNSKVSVFIPLDDIDENDPIISQLYPYKTVQDKNEEGYKYNLLPKSSEKCNVNATGSFFTSEEVINNPVILEVYDKYYKFTTKTNESGDYMIWGVPLGNQVVHMSVDVSDIGCYSMRPYQFIRQGFSPNQFESALEFKTSENLDTLPQVVIQNKTVQVVPFWGDDELCSVGITRTDFDLRDSGVNILPSAIFMGSIITDDDDNSTTLDGIPSREQGQLCNMTTGTGLIETVRHTVLTEDDGLTPKLEFFTLDNGGKVIDGDGTFVVQLPMNLDFVYTNEFGDQILSNDPTIGVPTKSKYRFRISFDSNGNEIRKGQYLVPNIREYDNDVDGSYTFSDDITEYPECSNNLQNCPANTGTDYFYRFEPNKVYTVANFIDNYRVNTLGGRNNGLFNRSESNSRWRFLGIKTINPAPEESCTESINPFPSNDVFRGGTTRFAEGQITKLFQIVSILISAILTSVAALTAFYTSGQAVVAQANRFQDAFFAGTNPFTLNLLGAGIPGYLGYVIFNALLVTFFATPAYLLLLDNFRITKQLFKFPNCEPCNCEESYFINLPFIWGVFFNGVLANIFADDERSVENCNEEPFISDFSDESRYYRGSDNSLPHGCYRLTFDNSIKATLIGTNTALFPLSAIPGGAVFAVFTALLVGLITAAVLLGNHIRNFFISLNHWRILSDIYTGLCSGTFNMKFSNNWINGTLYFFKFKRKVRNLSEVDGEQSPIVSNPVINYPQTLLFSNDDNNYYYRSSNFNTTTGFSVRKNNNPSGILFPTTICELGTLDPCIDKICGTDTDQCYFIDKLQPTSYQNSKDLLGMIVKRKIQGDLFENYRFSGINRFFGGGAKPNESFNRALGNTRIGSFNTPIYRGRVIDGDITNLIATNNMIGVSPYTTDGDDPYYGLNTEFFNEFFGTPLPNIQTPFPLLTSDDETISCVLGSSFGFENTQVVPYYTWETNGIGFGNFNNDYNFNILNTIGYQQGFVFNQPTSNNIQWLSPRYYRGFRSNPKLGFYTNLLPFDPDVQSEYRLGNGLFFYFGLRVGSTAYDKFLNEFLPPSEQ